MHKNIGDLTYVKVLYNDGFSIVDLYKQNNSNKFFAVKIYNKMIVKKSELFKYICSKPEILKTLDHPNITKLIKIINDKSQMNLFFVMEYCNGGSLLECLKNYQKKYQSAFPEEIIQHLMRQIVDALNYIHDKYIIHRDLKLDNIMVHFDNENDRIELNMMKAKIKVVGFFLAKKLPHKNALTNSIVGTPLYMAPNLLLNMKKKKNANNIGYGTEVDIWSLGCICYELFTGKNVFDDAINLEDLIKEMKKGKYKVPITASYEYINFLNNMLQYEGKNRKTAKELMAFPFLTKNVRDFKYFKQKKDENKVKKDMEEFNQSISSSFESNLINELVNQNNPNEIQISQSNYSIHAAGIYSIPGQAISVNSSLPNSQQNKTLYYQPQNNFYAYNNYYRSVIPPSGEIWPSNHASNIVNNNNNYNNIIRNSYGNIINVNNFNKKSRK